MLTRMAAGFGLVGLSGLLGPGAATAADAMRVPHARPRARRVIFLFMNGGPSHVDTFDPKPRSRNWKASSRATTFTRRAKAWLHAFAAAFRPLRTERQ